MTQRRRVVLFLGSALLTIWMAPRLLAVDSAVDPAVDSSSASLGRAVPADSFFSLTYGCAEGDSGFAAKHLQKLRVAVRDSGFFQTFTTGLRQRIQGMVESFEEQAESVPGSPLKKDLEERIALLKEELEVFDLNVAAWKRIFAKVEWWSLLSREVTVAGRLESNSWEWLLLFRVTTAEREARLAELRRILHGHAALVDGAELLTSDRNGIGVDLVFSVDEDDAQLCLTGRDDVVLVATSPSLLRQSLRLMDGRARGLGLEATAAYRESFEPLSVGPHSLATRSLAPRSLGRGARLTGLRAVLFPDRMLGDESRSLEGLESFALVADADDEKIQFSFVAELGAGKESSVRRLLGNAGDLSRLEARVPAGARGFHVTRGVQPAELLPFLARLVQEALPDGEILAEHLKSQWSEHLERLSEQITPHIEGSAVLTDLDEGVVLFLPATSTEKLAAGWDALLRSAEGSPFAAAISRLEGTNPALQRLRSVGLAGIDGLSAIVGPWQDGFVIASKRAALERLAKGPSAVLAEIFGTLPANRRQVTRLQSDRVVPWLRRGSGLLPLTGVQLFTEDEVSIGQPFLNALAGLGKALETLTDFGAVTLLTVDEGGLIRGDGAVELPRS